MKDQPIQESSEDVFIVNHKPDVFQLIRNLALNREAAFIVCNLNDPAEKLAVWKTVLPRVKTFYAVKCNDNRIVLETLAALGCGFDCASKQEIKQVLSIKGMDANRVIFAQPAKIISHLTYAASVGVDTMTFDCECELYKIQKYYPEAKLVIRIKGDAKLITRDLSVKFGCDAKTQAPHLLQLAKSLNLNVIGVSFHIGCECKEPEAYYRAIKAASSVFGQGRALGYNFSLLDIGGGFPGEIGQVFYDIANNINRGLDEFYSNAESKGISLIAEPGTYFVYTSYSLACNIHCVKEIAEEKMYYINDGVFGTINCVVNDNRTVTPIPLYQSFSEKVYNSTVWGPTCDSTDLVRKGTFLPKMSIGDWLVFEALGAYCPPLACCFNGYPLAEMVYVVSYDLWASIKDVSTLCPKSISNGQKNDSHTNHVQNGNKDFFSSEMPLNT